MKVTQIKTNLAQKQFWEESEVEIQHGFIENNAVCLYPQYKDQVFLGFGGAFTEAAAYTWQSLTEESRAALLNAYFGSDGLRYTLGRAHIGSCDFSLGNYSCIEDPEDTALTSFNMGRDHQYMIPMIRAAGEVAGESIRLLLSPWSPPAFMKTNGEMNHGGKLRSEYRELWAKCMARYVAEYRKAGVAVQWLSVQNEPDAVQKWDSCIYSAEEEGLFAAQYLEPALEAEGTDSTEILIWDHNKDQLLDRLERSFKQEQCLKVVSGAAFHWYSGDHFEAVELAHRRYPNLNLFFTEGCVEYSRFDGMTDQEKAERYAHDIIGNLNAGTNASIDWNLLLDEKGGPNHVGNFCEAPIMRTSDGDIEKKGSYYYLGHFSRYILPGAVKIGLSRCCSKIEATAFENADGTMAIVLLNQAETDCDIKLRLSRDTYILLSIKSHEIATILVQNQ